MVNKMVKRIFILLIMSIIFLIIGYLIATFISNCVDDSIKDVMLLEGIATVLITLACITKGDSLNLNIEGLGVGDKTHATLEAIKQERDLKWNFSNLKNNSTIKLAFNSLSILLGGIFMILFSVFFA
ncbi:hypothetical protein [Clostridium hydrogenum]|uniref:hypothetical protein n=1 Tax=Clostridium hydrogenum TaxID=2855764 RepID=UPI001F3920C9|nr:hypothetical protein [Clostridium hydrogenum]